MRKNYTKGVAVISIFTSLICFILSLFFLEFKIALLSSLLFALGLMIVLPFVLFYDDRKYKSIKANINDDILLNENVNMIIDGKIRNGYLIVSTKKLHIISRDKKPYIKNTLALIMLIELI